MHINDLKDPSGYFSMVALGAFWHLPAVLKNNVALREFSFQAQDTAALEFWSVGLASGTCNIVSPPLNPTQPVWRRNIGATMKYPYEDALQVYNNAEEMTL